MSRKFMLLDRPFMYPGKTICCQTTLGPVVDFGALADFNGADGAVYFCVDCLVEASLMTGKVIVPGDYKTVDTTFTGSLVEYSERLREFLTSGIGVLDSIDGLSSHLSDLPDGTSTDDSDGQDTRQVDDPAFDLDTTPKREGPSNVSSDSLDLEPVSGLQL